MTRLCVGKCGRVTWRPGGLCDQCRGERCCNFNTCDDCAGDREREVRNG